MAQEKSLLSLRRACVINMPVPCLFHFMRIFASGMCHPKHFLSQTLGFVSLVVFLVERSWVPNGKSAIDLIAESLNLGKMLKKTLHRLHFQLFGVSVRIPQERSLGKIVF
jgi:hypothetical protein